MLCIRGGLLHPQEGGVPCDGERLPPRSYVGDTDRCVVDPTLHGRSARGAGRAATEHRAAPDGRYKEWVRFTHSRGAGEQGGHCIENRKFTGTERAAGCEGAVLGGRVKAQAVNSQQVLAGLPGVGIREHWVLIGAAGHACCHAVGETVRAHRHVDGATQLRVQQQVGRRALGHEPNGGVHRLTRSAADAVVGWNLRVPPRKGSGGSLVPRDGPPNRPHRDLHTRTRKVLDPRGVLEAHTEDVLLERGGCSVPVSDNSADHLHPGGGVQTVAPHDVGGAATARARGV